MLDAGPAGLEPATSGSEGLRVLLDALSILGYGPFRELRITTLKSFAISKTTY